MAYRRAVQVVFQDPFSSLSPRMRVGDIIGEPLEIHTDLPRAAIGERVGKVLELVGLAPDVAPLFPHEFSGGQRQRIAIARALATYLRAVASIRGARRRCRYAPRLCRPCVAAMETARWPATSTIDALSRRRRRSR